MSLNSIAPYDVIKPSIPEISTKTTEDLPEECFQQILSYLDEPSRQTCVHVNRSWRRSVEVFYSPELTKITEFVSGLFEKLKIDPIQFGILVVEVRFAKKLVQIVNKVESYLMGYKRLSSLSVPRIITENIFELASDQNSLKNLSYFLAAFGKVTEAYQIAQEISSLDDKEDAFKNILYFWSLAAKEKNFQIFPNQIEMAIEIIKSIGDSKKLYCFFLFCDVLMSFLGAESEFQSIIRGRYQTRRGFVLNTIREKIKKGDPNALQLARIPDLFESIPVMTAELPFRHRLFGQI